MPGSGFLKFFDCLPCCKDTNGDGRLDWEEVLMNAAETTQHLQLLLANAAFWAYVLELDGGQDSQDAFQQLQAILQRAGNSIAALQAIHVNRVKGDVNNDGVVDKRDYKIYFEAGVKICDDILKAHVEQEAVQGIKRRFERIIGVLELMIQQEAGVGVRPGVVA